MLRRLTNDGQNIPPKAELFVSYTDTWPWPVHYGTARYEIERWLATVGRDGFFDLLAALQSGEAFEAAYENIEKVYQWDQ